MEDRAFGELADLAAKAEYGLEISVNDPDLFKRRFYAFRAYHRDRGNISYDSLSCLTSPRSTSHIWLIRKDKSNGKTQAFGPGENNNPHP